ncbi:MAG TPA: hypothetical protein DD670_19820 [Planctomycetaceae bacterium]|nr:hypothetical protein [Planctomycetaceae bacterium]
MDSKTTHKLETKLEGVIANVIVSELGRTHLPLLPDRRVMRAMAKAAVEVYKAAVKDHEQSQGG